MPTRRSLPLMLFALILLSLAAPALAALDPNSIPDPLRPWIPWVLHGEEEARCPTLNIAPRHECFWPSALTLDLDQTGGRASQEWVVYREGWVDLPGDASHWPRDVKVDGQPAVVTETDGKPRLRLAVGRHSIEATFRWLALPDALLIPPSTAILRLKLDGEVVPFPNLDQDGRVLLRQRVTAPQEESWLDVTVQRLISDAIPLQLITRFTVRVAGASREELLGRALPDGFVPMALVSSLPARLEPDGQLRVQLRPGTWLIELTARHTGAVSEITLPAGERGGREEIWVFQANNDLRVVEVEGVTPVNPEQTELADEWRQLPAYRVRPGETVRFRERQRGDSGPAADALSLNRTWWLDFDGGGYTIRDSITGTVRRSTRLEMKAPIELGRVAIHGADQFITRLPGSVHAGVELRHANLSLDADSRQNEDTSTMSAVGWDHDFDAVTAELNLPPGWELLHATGVDQVGPTWVTRWTLLDLFVVLIVAMAISRLWGWSLGLLALLGLGLTYTEWGAPRLIWLFVIAAEALVRALPQGRWKASARFTRMTMFGALLLMTLPFLVDQVRRALHPALSAVEAPAEPLVVEQSRESAALDAAAAGSSAQFKKSVYADYEDDAALARRKSDVDPNAVVQTGPGLPTWVWSKVHLGWTGPVASDQQLHLFLISPALNLMLAITRTLVLFALIALMLRSGWAGWSWGRPLAPMIAFLLISGFAAPARGELPPAEMLAELKQRLLAPPDCEPACASIGRMQLEVADTLLRVRLFVDVAADSAIALPGERGQWLPQTILVDGDKSVSLRRAEDAVLWLALSAGRHEVLLEGPLPDRDTVQIALPMKPHAAEVIASGWRVDGVAEEGVPEDNLQLTRVRTAGSATASLEAGTLPPFVRVTRAIRLGLTWEIETTVERLTPLGSAAILEVPLLAGESMTSQFPRVVDRKVQVNLSPQEWQMKWSSVLDITDALTLRADSSPHYTEVWRLEVGPIWHVTAEGIPAVQTTDAALVRQWQPWPGEAVTIAIARPEGIPGQTATIDRSNVLVEPGLRATDVRLEFALRSSRGGQHAITLPENSTLQSVSIDGDTQPIRQDGRQVVVPIHPGTQTIVLQARLTDTIRGRLTTPAIDLGVPSVNSNIDLSMPADRWILFVGGPTFGPAVLFWSLLAVTALVAIALGQVPLTPLRAHQWFLLGVGLTQVPVLVAMVVAGWLLAIGWRARYGATLGRREYNVSQLALVAWTLLALLGLVWSIQQGLLGLPEMQISGNRSSAGLLRWYQDRSDTLLPQAWVVSVPLIVYRFAMLAWALWLAQALIGWLRWGWNSLRIGEGWSSAPTVDTTND